MNNPIKPTIKSEILPLLILAAIVIASVAIYPMLPAQVASHWNFAGKVDGWTSREFHAIFFPCLFLGMYLLFTFMPYLDPKRERYAEFSGVYKIFRMLIIGVLAIVWLAATLYNLGVNIDVGRTVSLAIGLMIIVLGNYLGKIKKNWFTGIRTPWTLSSENVWNKTHRVGGYLFMLLGLAIIAGPYLPEIYGAIALFGTVALLIGGTFVYSYILYRQEKSGK